MKINIISIFLILALASVVISLKQNHFASKIHNSPKHQKPATTTPKPTKCPSQVLFLSYYIEYQKS
jgi:hypothetical protein